MIICHNSVWITSVNKVATLFISEIYYLVCHKQTFGLQGKKLHFILEAIWLFRLNLIFQVFSADQRTKFKAIKTQGRYKGLCTRNLMWKLLSSLSKGNPPDLITGTEIKNCVHFNPNSLGLFSMTLNSWGVKYHHYQKQFIQNIKWANKNPFILSIYFLLF